MGRRGSSGGGGGARARMSSSQVTSALREAQDLQQEGRLDEAIEICEELLESGVDRPDVHYFLGWLFQEADRWDDASSQFERLLDDPDYALSCCYALGQCARALGNIQDAAHYFDEAVDRVNLDALTREESDQLLQLCQEAAEAHRDMNDAEGAETIYSALLGFLRSQGWQDQVSEVERMMRETLGTAAPQPQQRRRRSASASRSLSENIPQRGKGGSSSANASPFNDGGMGQGMAGMPPMDPTLAFNGGSAQMPAMPPMSPTMAPGANAGALGLGAAASFGAAAMVPPVGGGMGTLVGGAPLGNVGAAAAPGDHLAQLINSLSGPAAGMRAGLAHLPEPYRSQVAQAVREIENYVAHGLLTAAIEECLRVMEIAPQYLDVHLLLGEIYVRQGKIEQAIAKYAILVDTYMVSGRMDDAIATYRRILQLEPNNLTYRVKLIELLTRQGRTEEALSERMLAADSYLRMGYADRAIQEYEQALLAYPNNAQVRLNYAAALMKAGRAAQAVSEYQRILHVDPTNTIALARWQIAQATGVGVAPAISSPGSSASAAVGANRVAALEALTRLLRALKAENQRSYDDVTREYVQALDANPGSADLRYALGEVHLAANRQQEALTCFQQVIPAPGMEVLARYASGQAFLLTGDPANAAIAVRELEEAAAAVRRHPPEPNVWAARMRAENEEQLPPEVEVSMLLARAYQMAGQVAQMQATLQSVSEQRPYNDEVYRVLAEVSARQSDPQSQLQEYAQLVRQYRANRQLENAVAVLKEMERVAPDEPAVRAELADVHVTRGLLDEGQAELKALADIHTRRGQLREAALVYQRMAEISWTSGAQEEALAQLRQAIQFSTDEMSLRHQFVQYCLEIGRNADAAEQQTVLARFYFASRQTKEAVAALQQLIAMDKHNFEAYDLLGQTYYSVGEYEQASRVYRKLATVDPNNMMARARLQELQAVRAQME